MDKTNDISAQDILDMRNRAVSEIEYAIAGLSRIANAFYTTGNQKMYDDLTFIADIILCQSNELQTAFNMMFDCCYGGAVQDGTANMLKAILAVSNTFVKEDKNVNNQPE